MWNYFLVMVCVNTWRETTQQTTDDEQKLNCNTNFKLFGANWANMFWKMTACP